MKKAFLIVLIAVLIASFVFAQHKRVVIAYEGFGYEKEVEINLKQLFGGDYDFVVGKTEHVDVNINFLTKVATLKAKDPTWKGRERIIFATDPVYLESTERLEELKVKVTEEGKVEEEIVKKNISYVIVSEEQILSKLDEMTRESFELMLPKIETKKVDVFTKKVGKSVIIDLSDEANINISFAQSPVKPAITMDMSYNTSGLKAPDFSPSSPERFYATAIFLFAFGLIFLYLKFGSSVEAVVFRKRGLSYAAKLKMERAEAKKKFLAALRGFERKQGMAAEIYKELANLTTNFLAEYYKVKSASPKEVMNAVRKEEEAKPFIELVRLYFSKAPMPYGPEKINAVDLKEFTRIVKKLSRKI